MHSKNFQLSFKNHNFTDYLGFYALKENNMARKAQNKKKYTFIDLFAGCGGLSEGFYRQGFQAVAHIEIDHSACDTLRERMRYYGYKNAENEVIATKLGPLDKELDETSEYGVENQAIAKKYNELRKQLNSIAQVYSIYGFARVNGDNSPAGTIFFGEDSNLKEITSHIHMGLTTKGGTLYKRCAN